MDDILLLRKRFNRERLARKEAEGILEDKARQLYIANQRLVAFNEQLEKEVEARTKELLNTEVKYQTLIESLNDIVYNTDSSGVFTYMNKIGFTRFGYSKKEVIGTDSASFIHKDYRQQIYDQHIEMIAQNRETFQNEIPIYTKDGGIRWVNQNVNVNYKDGQVEGYSIVARDITERRAMEDQMKLIQQNLENSEQKYRSIIENMQLGLLEVDVSGNIVKPYPIFCNMLGYRSEELIGRNARDLLVRGDDLQTKNFDPEVQQVHEEILNTKSGDIVYALISEAPYYDTKGILAGAIGIYYDISDIKRLQQDLEQAKITAEQAQLAEKQFIANISHEIRTPLNAIIGMSYLLDDTKLNEEQSEYTAILKSSSELLLDLISNVLDFSKIDAGEISLNLQPGNLDKLLNSIGRIFKIRMKNKSNTLTLNIEKRLDRYFLMDQLLINQICVNLLGNAGKFTENGTVELNAKVLADSDRNMTVLFEVSDTGIGIKKEDLNLVFEKFKQSHPQIGSGVKGTGLGLSIVKKIVNILGGDLSVESEFGKGSSFKFTLKLEKTESGLMENEKPIEYLFKTIDHPILVVDDNEVNLKYIAKLLEKWNLQFDLATNGQEAVDKCTFKSYSLILMDLQMPVMDGYEASTRLKAMDAFSNIPIIALTAFSTGDDRSKAFEVGMDDYLTKPFNPSQLNKLLSGYLKFENSDTSIIQSSQSEYVFGSALDSSTLEEIYGDDMEHALSMFSTFLEVHEEEYSKLQAAIHDNDYEQVRKIAHKMKPIFTMVGLPNLTRMMEDLENCAGLGDNQRVEELNSLLSHKKNDYLDLVHKEIMDMRKSKV